jgi:hypothetical protein
MDTLVVAVCYLTLHSSPCMQGADTGMDAAQSKGSGSQILLEGHSTLKQANGQPSDPADGEADLTVAVGGGLGSEGARDGGETAPLVGGGGGAGGSRGAGPHGSALRHSPSKRHKTPRELLQQIWQAMRIAKCAVNHAALLLQCVKMASSTCVCAAGTTPVPQSTPPSSGPSSSWAFLVGVCGTC